MTSQLFVFPTVFLAGATQYHQLHVPPPVDLHAQQLMSPQQPSTSAGMTPMLFQSQRMFTCTQYLSSNRVIGQSSY